MIIDIIAQKHIHTYFNKYVLTKESMNINVISIDGMRQEISMTYDTTCGQLKDKIKTIWGLLPSEQILIFNRLLDNNVNKNVELFNPNEKLRTYGVQNGSTINLTLKLSQFRVVVGSPTGKYINIPVNSQNTVKSLKDEIQKQLNVPVEEQTLIFRDEILENNKKLSECGIDKDCLISLIPKLHQFTVVVGSPCGKSIKIPVNSQNTVKSLKDELQKQLSVPVEEQTLMFREILENNKKLSEYGIDKECLISLIPKLKNEIQVIVQTGTSRNIAVKINWKKCISDLKYKIQQKFPEIVAFPKLIYQGELLHDDKTIDHYGIEENSVIMVHWIANKAMDKMKLLAKFIDGRVFVIYVSKNAIIYNIKSNIHEKLQIHPDDQKLIYQGAFLMDNKSLVEYQIGENSVIQVMPRMRF